MAQDTIHVYRRGKEGTWAVQNDSLNASVEVYPTRDQAIKAARGDSKTKKQSQVVVHKGKHGEFVIAEIHGLPKVQKPPQKSSIGRARIAEVISANVRRRLRIP